MKSKDVADYILRCLIQDPQRNMDAALKHGISFVIASYCEGQSLLDLQQHALSKWRQVFTFWKAVCSQVVESADWPDNMIGYRDRATNHAVGALPGYLYVSYPKLFLSLYDNNAFLGWQPDQLVAAQIVQLRWHHKQPVNSTKGLASNRMNTPDHGRYRR